MDIILRQISSEIWEALGPGYSESVYHRAFEVALRIRCVPYETERIVPVFYLEQNVGHIRADLIVDQKYVIELKSVGRLTDVYRIQTQNYISLLGLEDGFLINFPDKKCPYEFEHLKKSECIPSSTPCIF